MILGGGILRFHPRPMLFLSSDSDYGDDVGHTPYSHRHCDVPNFIVDEEENADNGKSYLVFG